MEGKDDEVLPDAPPSDNIPKTEDQNGVTKDNKEENDAEVDSPKEEEDTLVKKSLKLENMFDDDDDDDDDEEFPDSDAVQIPE